MNRQLFRGDGDYAGVRNLKTLLGRGLVQTNLVSGGNGREIFERPLIESIKNHVTDNWRSTHFLSFSESLDTALNFGKGKRNATREFDEHWDDNDGWDFIVMSISIHDLKAFSEKAKGIYYGHFIPTFSEFLPKYDVVLIDVVKMLSSVSLPDLPHQTALKNAMRDSEWLLLPAAPVNLGRGIEFRGLLDCVIFSDISKYRFQ